MHKNKKYNYSSLYRIVAYLKWQETVSKNFWQNPEKIGKEEGDWEGGEEEGNENKEIRKG